MRTLLRVMLLLLILIFVVPLVIPLPTSGVPAETLADPGGYFVEVNGLQTYVLEQGPQSGEVVLLLHGWGASTFSWRENISVLAEAGYRAIAFDRPPYGLSAKTGDIAYSPSAQADFNAALLDALEIDTAFLVGNSAGGSVAGYFAVRYPQRTAGLVLVDAALWPTDVERPVVQSGSGPTSRVGGALGLPPFVNTLLDFPPTARWAQIAIRLFVKPDFIGSILQSAYYDPDFITPEIAEGYGRQLQVAGWDEALMDQLRGNGFVADPLTADQLRALSMPVLIVWGENDTWIPVENGEILHALLPQSDWIVYPQTGHLPMEEAAAAFNRDLLIFLQEHAR